jgi:hypothetical protein
LPTIRLGSQQSRQFVAIFAAVTSGTNPALNDGMMTARNDNLSLNTDRRTSPRIELLGEINGQVMPFAMPVVLLDLSPGGFALASPVPFARHAEYTFQFNGTRPHGPIRAKDVHCLRVSHGTTDVSYVAGFSFVLNQPADQEVVDALIAEAQELLAVSDQQEQTKH